MKKIPITIMTLLIGLALLLSGCVAGPRVVDAPGISVSEDTAFVSYANFVSALDIEKGTVRWRFPAEGNNQTVFYAPPLVTEDYVYVGDLANKFHKIDIETGAEEWTFSESKGFFIGQAAIDGDTVYVPSNDSNMYVLDANGNLLWSFKTDRYIWAQPQVSSEAVFLASMDHFVYALSKDGKELWSVEMAGAVVGAPVLNDDGSVLFVGSIGKQMVALDTSDGELLWTFDGNGSLDSVWGNPILENDQLIFTDSSGQIYALDPVNGEAIWQTQVTGSVVGGLTAMADGFALATKEGVVKVFNYDSTPKWEATLEGEIYQAPAVNETYLVVGTINGENLIYAYSMAGVQLWSTTPGK